MEYIPTIPPLSHYVINICLYLAKKLHKFFSIVLITVDIYELTCPAQWEGGVNLLRTLFLRKKYKKNIDDV